MFKNKTMDEKNNITGEKINKSANSASRRCPRILADELQRHALDVEQKNAVQRIEAGKRFVTDIELKIIAQVLGVSYSDLLD